MHGPVDCYQQLAIAKKYTAALELLIGVVQELSMARDLPSIMAIVRHAARELTGADGATFVLRDGDCCYYADEEAIGPLWKGQRFPMSACISGWVMRHRDTAVIEDIYADSRVPVDAYAPTFVKSMAMVPIRCANPIGAIGNYWASPHLATPEEVSLLQSLADCTSLALENVNILAELEGLVRLRTSELQAANKELEAFNYSVAHDLKNPLNSIMGFADLLEAQYGACLPAEGKGYLARIESECDRMAQLIETFLGLARVSRTVIESQTINVSELVRTLADDLDGSDLSRSVEWHIQDGLLAVGDPTLLRIVFENLLYNAWKFTSRVDQPRIEIGRVETPTGSTFFVRDNGAGFDAVQVGNLFRPFERLHTKEEFPGTGIGLVTVQRIVERHGGHVAAEGRIGHGATFFISLPAGSSLLESRATETGPLS